MDRTSIIAAVSSPPGRSLRGLVRVSGPGAFEVLDRIVASTRPAWPSPSDARGNGGATAWSSIAHDARGGAPRARPRAWPRGVHAARLRVPAPGMAAILLVLPAPRSATGDDTFELLLPGNPVLLDMVIDALIAIDPRVRRAEAGEFSARAFMNGRLTLDQAEGLAALIRATNDAELDAAGRLARGALGEHCRAWSGRLAELAALVEAGIDFTDEEDVVAIAPEALRREAEAIGAELRASAGPGAAMRERPALPRVVLAGAPNAGKSTLFNALLGRRRTVESPVAGTTRDAIEQRWTIELPAGSIEAMLVDLPGLDADDDSPLSRRLRDAAARALREADLVLLCRAAAVGALPEPPPEAGASTLASIIGDLPRVEVATKCDRMHDAPAHRTSEDRAVHAHAALTAGQPSEPIRTSAVTGAGLENLRCAVALALGAATPALAGASSVLPRHRAALEHASACLHDLRERLRREPPNGPWRSPEEAAALLRQALDAIGAITGDTHADEILGLVFSRFCVGK